MEKIRILHIGSKLHSSGGIEKYVMNLYNNINRQKVQFDFVILDEGEKQYYETIIEKLGGTVHSIPKKNQSLFSSILYKYKIFRKYRNYGIIHIHTSCGIRAIDGLIAKLSGINKVIFHSHSNMGKIPLKYKLTKFFFRMIGSYFLACSPEAGKYFFGKSIVNKNNFAIAKNAIDFDQFKFCESKRSRIR
ncbi:MAG: glycosyltransferase family 1 protein, partial [Firmicutes bacterium HGW-Firmicutes-18]